MPGRPAGRDCA